MEQIVSNVYQNLDFFLLVFIRVTALIVSSPIFGRRNIPNMIKVCFCILLTYIVYTAYPDAQAIHYNGILEYALLCIKEMLFGLVLGYVTTLFFSIVQTAGYLIDSQIGLGMASVLDTNDNISVPMTGNFLYIVMIVSFFGVNGHLQLINILMVTFRQIPAGAVNLDPKIASASVEVFVQAFLLAVNVAMPIIASGLLGEVIMGFVVRTVPQMNVFVVGIPLKIILGFIVMLAVLPVYVNFTNVIFKDMFTAVEKMLGGLA